MPSPIRSVEAADFDAWYQLWLGYQRFYEADIPLETSQETWRRLLDRHEPVNGALALDSETGRPVGLVHFIYHRSTWTKGHYCYLQDLFVDPGYRGGGMGRALIEHVYHAARMAGCSRAYWLTHETNRNAMMLYDRVADRSGFVQYRKML